MPKFKPEARSRLHVARSFHLDLVKLAMAQQFPIYKLAKNSSPERFKTSLKKTEELGRKNYQHQHHVLNKMDAQIDTPRILQGKIDKSMTHLKEIRKIIPENHSTEILRQLHAILEIDSSKAYQESLYGFMEHGRTTKQQELAASYAKQFERFKHEDFANLWKEKGQEHAASLSDRQKAFLKLSDLVNKTPTKHKKAVIESILKFLFIHNVPLELPEGVENPH
ncbi:hypothetical protein K8R43_00585 [archaeon]|nr:hypothetical protein [archaeon]